jgi:preprotein translocase subunit SecF
MHIFKDTNYDFIKWRVHALVLSWAIILAGLAVIAVKGIPKGVEFSGGTIVIAKFDQVPSVQQVRAALDQQFPGGNAVVQSYGGPGDREIMIRVPQVGVESGGKISQTKEAVVSSLKQANLGNFTVIGTEIVGPVVGKELTRKGILATVLSLVGILLYIAFRFQFSFAVGAVVATIHDLLITLAFLAFFRYDLSLNVIAAILTVSGYSTNDTIVIFDRVRENLRSMRRDSLKDVVNRAVNQTLGRTVITAGTAFLSAVALFIFGGEVLRGFAFTMIVGVVTGTYSSVFIAGAVVTYWHKRAAKAAVPAAPPTQAPPAARARQKNRKARAS